MTVTRFGQFLESMEEGEGLRLVKEDFSLGVQFSKMDTKRGTVLSSEIVSTSSSALQGDDSEIMDRIEEQARILRERYGEVRRQQRLEKEAQEMGGDDKKDDDEKGGDKKRREGGESLQAGVVAPGQHAGASSVPSGEPSGGRGTRGPGEEPSGQIGPNETVLLGDDGETVPLGGNQDVSFGGDQGVSVNGDQDRNDQDDTDRDNRDSRDKNEGGQG